MVVNAPGAHCSFGFETGRELSITLDRGTFGGRLNDRLHHLQAPVNIESASPSADKQRGVTSAHLRWRRDRVSHLSPPVNIQRVARLPVQQLLGTDGLILAVGQVCHDVEDFEGEGE
jgi:hypothetical protein